MDVLFAFLFGLAGGSAALFLQYWSVDIGFQRDLLFRFWYRGEGYLAFTFLGIDATIRRKR